SSTGDSSGVRLLLYKLSESVLTSNHVASSDSSSNVTSSPSYLKSNSDSGELPDPSLTTENSGSDSSESSSSSLFESSASSSFVAFSPLSSFLFPSLQNHCLIPHLNSSRFHHCYYCCHLQVHYYHFRILALNTMRKR